MTTSLFEIFEPTTQNFKLFTCHNPYSQEIILQKEILFQGDLYTKTNGNELKIAYFKIQDRKLLSYSVNIFFNFLFFLKNCDSKVCQGYYDLMNFMKLSNVGFKENGLLKFYSFKLEKFNQTHEFFHKDKKVIIKWVNILKFYCICKGFYKCYEILESIGKGHFAQVYKVKSLQTQTYMAAKIIKKNKIYEEQKQFIYNEIKILKTLPKHDNIIKLYEVYEDQHEIILIFQLMEGRDIYYRLKSGYHFTEEESCTLFCNVLRAIKFLHSNGVAHRDIKPENVLLSGDKKHLSIKLADFSLADYFVEKGLYMKCGTPGYMAPEIFTEDNYDERVDIYSLGILLYMLLVGKSPFKGKDAEEVIMNNRIGNIKFKKDWKKISKSAKKLVMRMTSKDPNHRITLSEILINSWITKILPSSSLLQDIEHFDISPKSKKEKILNYNSNENTEGSISHFKAFTANMGCFTVSTSSKTRVSSVNFLNINSQKIELRKSSSNSEINKGTISIPGGIKSINSFLLGSSFDENSGYKESNDYEKSEDGSPITNNRKFSIFSRNNSIKSILPMKDYDNDCILMNIINKDYNEESFTDSILKDIHCIFLDINPVQKLLNDLNLNTNQIIASKNIEF